MRDLIITIADKGNQVVVLDKDFYIAKGEEMLSDKNVYKKLRSNPLKSEQTRFNNNIDSIYKSMGLITPYQFKSRLPDLPYLYITPKIHKNPLSFRPIIAQTNSISRALSQFL